MRVKLPAATIITYYLLLITYFKVPSSLHACGINLREFGIIQHNGADGTLCRFDVKSGSCHLVTEIVYILYQLVMQRIAFFQHLEYFETCTDDTRSQ